MYLRKQDVKDGVLTLSLEYDIADPAVKDVKIELINVNQAPKEDDEEEGATRAAKPKKPGKKKS
jgi:hypothetical protein